MSSIVDLMDAIDQKGAIAENRPKLYVTPTRLAGFNTEVLRTGGMVGGRIYELYAPNSAGKSTLAQIICADYQKAGKLAVYFDVEGTTQTETKIEEKAGWMQSLGIDTDNLLMPSFGSAEDLFGQVKKLIIAGANVIVIDTVAVLQPEAMIFRENENMKMNETQERAKVLTRFFNDIDGGFAVKDKSGKFIPIKKEIIDTFKSHGVKITNPLIHKLSYYDCAIIGINHAKTMIGVLYGDPIYTVGGDGLGFHSSIRLGMTKPTKSKEKIKRGDYEVPLFRKTRLVAAKNKLSSPFGEMTLKVYADGRVQEDIPMYLAAEAKGIVEVGTRQITFLVGSRAGEKMKRVDFESFISEDEEYLPMLGSDYEIESEVETAIEVLPKKKPISFGTMLKT